MTPARVIDTHRLSVLAHEYEREIVQFFHDLTGPDGPAAGRIRREAGKIPFEEIRTDAAGSLLARIGTGKHTILLEAHNAAGMAAALYGAKLIHELGMYDDFTLWVGQWRIHAVRESGIAAEGVLIAEPTNLCIGMSEAAAEGFLSESHPLVEAAIGAYETLFELPPIVSQSPTHGGPIGIPAIVFGPGEVRELAPIHHLLKAAQFYAAFPTMYVDAVRRR